MVEIFSQWIATHKAVTSWFHAAHHLTKGVGFGGDHVNIYGKIYQEMEDDFDAIVEKGLGLCNDESLADPLAIFSSASAMLGQYFQPSNSCPDKLAIAACELSKRYVDLLQQFYTRFESCGGLTMGLDDMMAAMANRYETHVYLLQQRTK